MKNITIILLVILIIIIQYSEYPFFPYHFWSKYEKTDTLDILPIDMLEKGKNEIKKHKLLVLGISRDNVTKIKPVIKHIEKIGSEFNDYRVIIFENDSTDGTKLLLSLWSYFNKKVTIITQDFHLLKRPSIKFLAEIRNKYLDYISDKYPDFDMVLILDMDMHYGWDNRGVYDSFAKINEWDALCANGIYTLQGHMWDAFAYRDSDYDYDISNENFWTDAIPKAQRIHRIGSDLVPVKSCFNGMSFYKRKFLENCRYDSINGNCEHIEFHSCIIEKNHAKMFLNPSMIIYYKK